MEFFMTISQQYFGQDYPKTYSSLIWNSNSAKFPVFLSGNLKRQKLSCSATLSTKSFWSEHYIEADIFNAMISSEPYACNWLSPEHNPVTWVLRSLFSE